MSELNLTEFGNYPKHWVAKPILALQDENILLIEDGNHGNYRPLRKEFVSDGIAYIKAGDIDKNQVLFKSAEKINKTAYSRLRKGKSINGDTIITHKGTVGKVAYISKNNIYPHVCSPQTTFYRSLDNDQILKRYIFYYLISPFFQNQFDSRSGESDMAPYVSLTNQRDLLFLIPPVFEQSLITEVLTSLDDKIELLHRQNQTLEQIAETLFRQWFVENPNPDWGESPLSSIATFVNGLACQKYPPQNEVDKLPVLKIKELRNGISADCDWCTTEVDKKYIVENGDIIFSWSASLMVKIWDGETCILNQHLFKVTSAEYPKWYYYFWSKFHLNQFVAIARAHATTMGHIKRGNLDEAMVLIPSDEEIETFTETIEPIIEKIIINNRQISKLVALRDTLLPKLMSGEIRIDTDE